MIFLIVLVGPAVLHQEEGLARGRGAARTRARAGPKQDQHLRRIEKLDARAPFGALCVSREDRAMTKAVLGIIGGSGIYDLPGLENVREERIESPWGEPSGAACASARSPACRSCSCRATTRATGCRPPTSTTAPISTCSSAPASPIWSRSRPAARSRRSCRPAPSCWSTSSSTAPTSARARSSARAGRACLDGASGVAAAAHRISPRPRQAEGIAGRARRHLRLHGRPAVLHATPRA